MSDIIEIKKLCKQYKNVNAVKGINFSVREGSFFALLGENGAGKSTTINIIATLVRKTSGDIIVNDHHVDSDDHKIRRDIGVVFQGNMLDKYLSVKENIFNRGISYSLSKGAINTRMQALSEKIGVTDFLDRRYGTLSGGQKRRADIVRALINTPKILILDEPTTGLDPYTRKCVWETIQQLREESNLTLFLTTHYMEEAAAADHIVIMDSGEIKATGTPEQLRLQYSSDRLILIPKKTDTCTALMKEMSIPFSIDRDRMIVLLKDSLEAIEIVYKIQSAIEGFEVIRGNMDDVFINITDSKSQCKGVDIE